MKSFLFYLKHGHNHVQVVLEWLVQSKSGDNIELVTEEILEDMVDKWVSYLNFSILFVTYEWKQLPIVT